MWSLEGFCYVSRRPFGRASCPACNQPFQELRPGESSVARTLRSQFTYAPVLASALSLCSVWVCCVACCAMLRWLH
jgi:hypothetical protein